MIDLHAIIIDKKGRENTEKIIDRKGKKEVKEEKIDRIYILPGTDNTNNKEKREKTISKTSSDANKDPESTKLVPSIRKSVRKTEVRGNLSTGPK
jgi:hypothetical protein